MNGLTHINIELSSRCDKNCWCCGRRKIERDFPQLADWGDMAFEFVEVIARQLPPNIVVAFHWNGESTLYPEFGRAVSLFKNQIKCLDTNGKHLLEKFDEMLLLDTLTISVIESDPEGEEQYEIVRQFLDMKKTKKPLMVYRLLGDVSSVERWHKLPGLVATRTLHNPMGSRDYKKPVTIPEIGVCLDFLTHLAIDRYGYASICVRFDPYHVGRIGHVKEMSLEELWRKKFEMWGEYHFTGQRDKVRLCSVCDYWGIALS